MRPGKLDFFLDEIVLDAYTVAVFAVFILVSEAQQAGGRAFGDSMIFAVALLAFTLFVRLWNISRDAQERRLRFLS